MIERAKSDNVQLKVRTKEPLRAKLEAAALDRGVSMNTEIVDRLDRSFDQDERLEDLFGSRDLYGIMKMVATAMTLTGKTAEQGSQLSGRTIDWRRDPYAFDQAVESAVRILQGFRPPGDVVKPQALEEYVNKDGVDVTSILGLEFAQLIMEDVITEDDRLPEDRKLRRLRLRTELGPLIDVLKRNRVQR
jgi:Arc-like DNA binding domain